MDEQPDPPPPLVINCEATLPDGTELEIQIPQTPIPTGNGEEVVYVVIKKM
jgi:hypothetical protein